MKKLFLVCFAMLIALNVFAQSAANKKNKLPAKKDFKAQYDLFLENEQYCDHWSHKWTYEKSKEAVSQELKDFDSYLTAQKSNYEIGLLDLIIKTYLYNLDEIDHSRKNIVPGGLWDASTPVQLQILFSLNLKLPAKCVVVWQKKMNG